MKILKFILLFVGTLIGLALIIAAFTKKEFSVERSIVINKPKAEVFDYVSSLKSQNDWSVWGSLDPNMKKEFIGTDKTVGFVSKWEGNDDVGSGEQEIKKIIPGERMETELRFLKPFKVTNIAHLITESVDSSHTTVKWRFEGKMAWPMNIMNMMMDITIAKDFEKGLSNLKAKLEQ